jgi:hypothetical protein
MPLLEHQIFLGQCMQVRVAKAATALIADIAQGLAISGEELERLHDLVCSPGFGFTRRVQRSWCLGRTAAAAQLTLSLLPIEQRREFVENWVEGGGGRAFDLASEAAAFLDFIAFRLTDPSHALTVCRMQQAFYRASEAALRLRPPDLSLLDDPTTRLRPGDGAALVRFFAEPRRLFAAIEAKEPLPPLSDRHFAILFAPGLPKLYRAATNDEMMIWEEVVGPTEVHTSSCDSNSRYAIEELLRIGAVQLAEEP